MQFKEISKIDFVMSWTKCAKIYQT